jgi:hypothetical protein
MLTVICFPWLDPDREEALVSGRVSTTPPEWRLEWPLLSEVDTDGALEERIERTDGSDDEPDPLVLRRAGEV